jgi:hypothetical protein
LGDCPALTVFSQQQGGRHTPQQGGDQQAHPADVPRQPDKARVLELAELPPSTPVKTRSLDAFFKDATREEAWHPDRGQLGGAEDQGGSDLKGGE